jgi:hypothetical protein
MRLSISLKIAFNDGQRAPRLSAIINFLHTLIFVKSKRGANPTSVSCNVVKNRCTTKSQYAYLYSLKHLYISTVLEIVCCDPYDGLNLSLTDPPLFVQGQGRTSGREQAGADHR